MLRVRQLPTCDMSKDRQLKLFLLASTFTFERSIDNTPTHTFLLRQHENQAATVHSIRGHLDAGLRSMRVGNRRLDIVGPRSFAVPDDAGSNDPVVARAQSVDSSGTVGHTGSRIKRDWSRFHHHKPATRAGSSRRIRTPNDNTTIGWGEAPVFEPFWKLGEKQRSRLDEERSFQRRRHWQRLSLLGARCLRWRRRKQLAILRLVSAPDRFID